MSKNIELAGLLLGLTKPVELSETFRKFLTTDGMDGIKDLELMLSDSKLCKKIPEDVRVEYEILYYSLSTQLDDATKILEQEIKKIRSNSKSLIHDVIQYSLDLEED